MNPRRAPVSGHRRLLLWAALAALLSAVLPTLPFASIAAVSSTVRSDPGLPDHDWSWPATGHRTVVVPFRASVHAYGPGHRGIDIASSAQALAPADGVIAFSGRVVDRPLVTIDHRNGLVTTLEPVMSPLAPGTVVHRGDAVGEVAAGGHTPAGALHVGVRWNGAYINPMLLFGGVERAVLLPCGSDGC